MTENKLTIKLQRGGGKQYLYIVQSSLEPAKCKIGITDNLERRLREYNSTTGQSKDNIYTFLFSCEVRNMREIENAVKHQFPHLREQSSREIYFYNNALFDQYVDFIRSSPLFVREVFHKPDEKRKVVKIVKRSTPSLKERGITAKDVMQRAKRIKNDEFYTRYEDVEKEISMYPPETWHGKCVFCNCDDAVGETRTERDSSAFALFFIKNFIRLGLKKLICTHYSGQTDLFNAGAKGYVFTKNGVREMTEAPKYYTGCFEDPLSLKILREQADIVCTNPPFSQSIHYWEVLVGSKKKFLIISNMAICLTTAYLHYFMDRIVWAGFNSVDWYLNPKREPVRAAGHWFTNIKIRKRPKIGLLKVVPLKDIPDSYKKFDDENILIVDNNYIPSDYKEIFGVSARPILNGLLDLDFKIISEKEYYPYVKGKKCYSRILVQKTK